MPLYDYECVSCGNVFELRQSFDASPEGICPSCAGISRRKFHPVPIIYKGTGFYTTDSKNTGYSGTSKNGGEEEGPKEEGPKKENKSIKASPANSDDKRESAKEA